MRFRRNDDVFTEALKDAGLDRSVARQLATAGTPINVAAGTALCREGDFGKEAFVLVSGSAVVRLDTNDRQVRPGEVFGEMAVLDPRLQRTATVEVTEPSLVLVYDVPTFRYLAQQHADLLAPPRAA